MAVFPTAAAADSDLYIAVNNLSTTLTDNPLTSGATTVNVSSATAFPTVGFITIDTEVIKYTGTTTTSFTGCTRGADGTTAASHLVNAQVYQFIVAAHHNVLKDEVKAIETKLYDGASPLFAGLTVPSINGNAFAKNMVINGSHEFDQRNEGSSVALVSNVNTYGVDTFFGYNRGATALWTTQRTTSTPPTGFQYYTHLTVTTPDASPAATSEYVISTRVEGPTFAHSNFGTANPLPVTVSFWVRSSLTGTFGFSIESGLASSNANVGQYTISSANTWQYVTLSFTGDTTGTWLFGEGQIGLKLLWDLGSGSNFAGTAGTWTVAQEANHVTGNTRLVGTNGATWDLTGVQCEFGTQATAFEWPDYQTRLTRVRRYYEKSYAIGTAPGTNTGNASGSNVINVCGAQLGASETDYASIKFLETKAIVPTMSFWAPDGTSNNWKCFNTSGSGTNRTITGTEQQGKDYMGFYQTTAVELFAQGHYTAEANL